MNMIKTSFAAFVASAMLTACNDNPGGHQKIEPSKVENSRPESALTTITLTEDAVRRLGIEIGQIDRLPVQNARLFAGVVTPAPGASSLVAAPFDGIVAGAGNALLSPGKRVKRGEPVLTLRGIAAQTAGISPDQAIPVRRLERDNASARLQRTEELLKVEGASEEEVERARADFAQAEAAYESLRAQMGTSGAPDSKGSALTAPISGVLGDYSVGPGQLVKAGDPLFRVTSLSDALIRVPVFASDLDRIGKDARAKVSRMGSDVELTNAVRVDGPPTATTLAASVDLYFLIESLDTDLRPGERVAVTIALGQSTPQLTAPPSAIFTDFHGGNWVYERIEPTVFTRRRVFIDYFGESLAVLAEGPAPGTQIVTVGVAELAGAEFGIGK